MNMNTLRAANVARDQEWNTGSERLSLTFRATELAGEVGEACNVIKKLERERIGLVGSRDTKEHLAEELADIVICTDLVAMDAGIDLDAAIAAKFNATSEKNGLATRLSISPAMALPFEATPAMVKAALDLVWEESETHGDLVCRLWRAMAAVAPDQPSAAIDVLAERHRQIEAEGWTPEHDDGHRDFSIPRAAATYAYGAGVGVENRAVMDGHGNSGSIPILKMIWPMSWDWGWYKPKNRRADLVKAAALILAEVERLDRFPTHPSSEVA
ncbi:MazG-like family protein [Brucella anthropi]|uniref:MazG-like family protein n=1 Tax=Brucella anthropi TaxID=529 RepID=UPI00124C884A|nr:MazG-like family protein [Brucella anthropi]KAB2783716.1 hypothetical protein F9K99_04105 [Brucella anthropi]